MTPETIQVTINIALKDKDPADIGRAIVEAIKAYKRKPGPGEVKP